ncbi:MAG: helix-hairpin-helix domain-containing protein [Candidatus Ozemobacteraceae bacterium]
MRTRRTLISLTLIVMLGVLLSGCSSPPPSNPPTNTDPYKTISTDPYNSGTTGSQGTTDPYSSTKPGNTDPYNSGSTGNTDPYNTGHGSTSNTDPYSTPSGYNRVNINTAGHAELDTLPGIGPVLADEIINYRYFYGPFRTSYDLVKVRGIGEAKYAAIANMITCSGGASSGYVPPVAPSNTDPYSSNTDPYSGSGSSGKLNINFATQAELEVLPGIGPAKARAIIDYRTRYGKFQRVEDVRNVPGIGDATYQKIAGSIMTAGSTSSSSTAVEQAYQRYTQAYRKYTSLQTDPYSSYTDQRLAYDEYVSAKKEYDRLRNR